MSTSTVAEPTLTPAMIAEDLRTTGLKLAAEEWFPNETCGCPMAVHYLANNASGHRDYEEAETWCYMKFGRKYVEGFIRGFDLPRSPLRGEGGDRYVRGQLDGMRAKRNFARHLRRIPAAVSTATLNEETDQ